MPEADTGDASNTGELRDRHSRRHDGGKLERVRRLGALLCACAAATQAGCSFNDKAMKFLQCEMTVKTTSGKQIDDMLLNARAMAKCKYDLDGRMRGR